MAVSTKICEFKPETAIPDLAGKVVFITGGTSGLGSETIYQLAKHNPARIYFSGRNKASAEKVIAKANELATAQTEIPFIQCDLSSLQSVSAAAKAFVAQESRLDILICNAGIMAAEPGLSVDGYEIQFATNHLGHALLMKHLLPLLQQTAKNVPNADVRLLSLTSQGYAFSPSGGVQYDSIKTVQNFGFGGSWKRYGQSKVANLLYAREIAKRYPEILSVSIHPGVVKTGLADGLSLGKVMFIQATTWWQQLEIEQGAYSTLWAVGQDRQSITNGAMYEPVGKLHKPITKDGKDESGEVAGKLWEWTQDAIREF